MQGSMWRIWTLEGMFPLGIHLSSCKGKYHKDGNWWECIEAKQKQVEADIRLKITSYGMQCNIITQHISMGAPQVNSLSKIEKNMKFQHNVMVGLNRAPKPMKVLQHRHQTVNKILTRELMNDRLYHMNYDTSKHIFFFFVATQWGRS